MTNVSSPVIPTASPLSIRPDISCIMTGLTIFILCSAANKSTANIPLVSVAVVITGIAPILSASSLHHSLAPPICPESSEIRNLPLSSATSTAGSVTLLLRYGAIVLTAIAAAHTNNILSHIANSFLITLPTVAKETASSL